MHDLDTPLPPEFRWVKWDGREFVSGSFHVGFGYSYGSILTTRDGAGWNEYPNPAFMGTPSDIAWGGDRYVAAGGQEIAYAFALRTTLEIANGFGLPSWFRANVPGHGGGPFGIGSVAWGAGRFVAVGDLGAAVLQSADGERWTVQPLPTHAALRRVMFDGGRFVAVGDDLTIVTSPDGLSWRQEGIAPESMPAPRRDAPLRGVTWNGSQWVAVGGYGVILLCSGTCIHPQFPRKHLERLGP